MLIFLKHVSMILSDFFRWCATPKITNFQLTVLRDFRDSAPPEKIWKKVRVKNGFTKRGILTILSQESFNKLNIILFQSFVHISTAFSHCVLNHIEEIYYEPPADPEKILSLVEILDDDSLKQLSTGWLTLNFIKPVRSRFNRIFFSTIFRPFYTIIVTFWK